MKGSGGIYTVHVLEPTGERLVARKTLDHGFPTEAQVVEAVRAAGA